jgi:lauroyl/myristoyl acyltransferase
MSKIYKHSQLKLASPKYILTWLLFFFIWIIGQLSHNTTIALGKYTGQFFYLLFPKRRYIIKTNLTLCFPEKSNIEIKQLVKQNFQSLVTGIFETAIAWYGSDKTMKRLDDIVVFENEEILKTYIQANKPLLLITPHSLSQELLGRYIARKYNCIPVFRHMNNPVANYLMQKARLRIYKNLIQKANTRTIVKTLKSNSHPVAILPDQDFGKKRSIFAPFFGVQTATTTALSKYKKLTDANMLMLGYHRKFNAVTGKFERFILTIYPELNITGYDLMHDAIEFNTKLEEIIKKDISAYFWVARKFKTRPAGVPKIYNYQSINPLKRILLGIKK